MADSGFVFPSNLRVLEEEATEENHLVVQNPVNVSSLRASELEEFVKGVSFDLSDKELFCIEEQDVFDRVYSLVRDFSSLPPLCKYNLVESLRSNFSVLLPNVDSLSRMSQDNHHHDDAAPLLDRLNSHRNAFKIYTFFLVNVVLDEESKTGAAVNSKVTTTTTRKKNLINAWNWESQRGRILNLIANSLEINLTLLFGSSSLDENYLSFVAKNAFSMFENATLLKDPDTKDALCRIIGACATKWQYIAQCCASIMHLIHRYDFVVIPFAEAVSLAEKKYADGTLATSLTREIGRTNPKSYVKDTVGAENVGRFLVELADRMPKLITTNVGLLIPHFGGDSYKIRNALVGVLGKLIAKAFKDIEGEMSSKSVRLRTKQAMLEILLERCRDVSAYTRSRVLQVWGELCEEHSISIGLWNEVADVAAGRLEDKSAIVRKYALNLLIMMLQHNPFGPQLRITSFETTLEQYKKKLNELEPDNQSDNVIDGASSDNDTIEQQDSLTDSQIEENVQKDITVPDVGNSEQTRALVASLEAGLRFSKCVSATMPTLLQLMASSSATDVENTIHLLMRCKQFQIDGAEACLRKMLPLVFSQDKSIYEAVENAFITIYIRKSPAETAKCLLNLAIDSNIGDQAALEHVVGALVSKGDISTNIISALWDFFCFNVSGTTAEQSRGALSVLCMAAKSSSGVLTSHIQDIIDIGFGRWAKVDPLLARTACIALQRLSEEDKKKLLLNNGSRIFSILESLVTGFWLPDNIWYAAADRAICAIYTIHPTPETLAADLIKKSFGNVFNFSGGDDDIENGNTILASVQIQKQRAVRERQASDDQNGQVDEASKDNSINAELGLAASEDAKLDMLSERAEKEIVSGDSSEKNLIGQVADFLSKLCRNFSLMQKYPELQASAMLALCRLMIVDANYCSANLQLLFTVVESSPSETVRSNCTIALGDLAVRFPNLLEPWTENMYTRLRDSSVSVRKNAVLVLSHLILNDMMKVKGHINEMAIRVEDDDERISNLVKLFFHELSKKGSNPIYNLLPDILGKLCNQNLERESFYNIMQFLIGSIKKDKQMEALVEKLCNRFSGVTDVRQWEYMSYCLSQLTFTEKGMKKLIDLFKTYEHALSEDSVMDHFKNIINKGKKFAKPELKVCIEEFEEKLNKFHLDKKDQEETARNAQLHQQKVDCLETVLAAENSGESEITEDNEDGDSENDREGESENVGEADSSVKRMTESRNNKSRSKLVKTEQHSDVSSEVTESDPDGVEVQSPKVDIKGTAKSRGRKTILKDKTINTPATVSNNLRSTRRSNRIK
ncbi:hypothetical protein ACFE04_015848 [Oxalis oulophora]